MIASAACSETLVAVIGIRYSRRRRHVVGVETLVGRTAEVVSALAPTGQVKLRGEIWQARSEGTAQLGEMVRIKAIDGLTLDVERVP